MKKILIVDGNSILNRAYYGIRPLTTKEGLYTNAIYGMITILSKQLEQLEPEMCAIAFDRKEPTFRHKAYAEYKAGRHASPEELRSQFPLAKECAAALGFHILELPGYEADDILGTLSKNANEAGYDAYLLTGDRDSLQLIDDHTTVLLATNKETILFDRLRFFTTYGVEPSQFVDVKALMGDSSDNIPGVAGIGEKTALKLIAEYKDLENLYAHIEDTGIAKGVRAKLVDGKDNAFFSRMLATIVRDVPLEKPFSQLESRALLYDRAQLRKLFVRLEFSALLKRMNLDAADPVNTDYVPPETETYNASPISAAELSALPTDRPYAVVVDTRSQTPVLYVAYADLPGDVPAGTEHIRSVCQEDDPAAWKDFLCAEGRFLISDNTKALYHTLWNLHAGDCTCGFDTTLAGYVLNPTEADYTPERLVLQYLGEVLPERVTPAALSKVLLRMYPVLWGKIQENEMTALYTDVELPLAKVLFRMENKGFQVDVSGLRTYGERLNTLCETYMAQIYEAAGVVFNVNSPKQLGEVLFDRLGLPSPTSKRSTNAEVLEKLRPYHPIISCILEYRQVAKLKSTYADGLLKVAGEDGRVHSSFHQAVTATGRLSSSEPNLQNIPVRMELGRELRRYFIPSDSDHVLVDADYSQIELRLLAAISGDEAMTKAFCSDVDIHTITASQVFHIPKEEVTPALRSRAKAVNFGIVYGIGDYSLAADIGVSRKEAAAYIESYKNTYPGVAAYLTDVVQKAKETGYVTTLFGRRRYIPELIATKKTTVSFGERIAMNSPIQGSAADIIKAAMVRLDRELTEAGLDAHLILQVHDELIVECHKSVLPEVRALLKRVMEETVTLSVPLTVDVQAGENWFEGH